MTYLYLIRHARSTWNAEGRMQGQADAPLDDTGRQQAQVLGERMKRERLDALYSSPLQRASHTAEAVAVHHRLTIRFDDRLMERHLGQWTGLTGNEADEQFPGVRAGNEWRVAGPPEGESVAQVASRVAAALSDILAAQPEARVAVVSHGGTLNAGLRHLLGLPPEAPVHFHWGNTAIARVRIEAGLVNVVSIGDNQHLNG